MAHIDAGKTTTTERILYHTGRIHKIGEVHDGAATMDWMAQEQERGITITSAATTAFWNDHRINIIDTPGHVDFTVEVSRSLRVLDGAVTVLMLKLVLNLKQKQFGDKQQNIKSHDFVYVNKMDKIGADFQAAIESLKDRLGVTAVPIQWPIGAEADFTGIIDLVTMTASEYDGEMVEEAKQIEIPAHLKAIAEEKRIALIEAVAEFDEELMIKYLEGEEVTNDEIKQAIRKGTLKVEFFPVICGTSFKNKGVKKMIDAVIDYLPSPVDVEAVIGMNSKGEEVKRKPSDNEPFSALAFKVMTDPYVGRLTFFRVYSGKLSSGSYVMNSTKR